MQTPIVSLDSYDDKLKSERDIQNLKRLISTKRRDMKIYLATGIFTFAVWLLILTRSGSIDILIYIVSWYNGRAGF